MMASFFNALTECLCEHYVCVCVRACLCERIVCVFQFDCLFPSLLCLWSYPVYQHMFTELQEHASARFMKHNRYPESV